MGAHPRPIQVLKPNYQTSFVPTLPSYTPPPRYLTLPPLPRYYDADPVTVGALVQYLKTQTYETLPIPRSKAPYVRPIVAALATLPVSAKSVLPRR